MEQVTFDFPKVTWISVIYSITRKTEKQDIFNGYLDTKHVAIYFTVTFDIPVYYHNFSNFFFSFR